MRRLLERISHERMFCEHCGSELERQYYNHRVVYSGTSGRSRRLANFRLRCPRLPPWPLSEITRHEEWIFGHSYEYTGGISAAFIEVKDVQS